MTLTKGFWLADTTVNQALCKAVMGENPSRFKGDDERPVENISWEDAQMFIDKMNSMKAELKLCLPTEAQWEYACRAGTETPFSFGNQISPEIVNYNGRFSYNNGPEGKHREQTVAVKSFPPNDWGLFEMHGNVWEWCQDSYGEYQIDKVIDPQGVDAGDNRVLRGGSWFNGGRSCRSACRTAGGRTACTVIYNN